MYDGDCLYFGVNNASNQARGYSDLLQVLDWLDQLDEVLWAVADRERFASFFSWLVKVSGLTESGIKDKATALSIKIPQKTGQLIIANENEDWSFLSPDLKQPQSLETANQLLTFILGGLGLPRHWYGFGDETNRATAEAQNDPTWRRLQDSQDEIQWMIEAMIGLALSQAQIAGANVDLEDYQVTMPPMTAKDVTKIASSLSQISQVLVLAVEQGWIVNEDAAKIFADLASRLGYEIEADEAAEDDSEPMEAEATIESYNVLLDDISQHWVAGIMENEGD